MRSLPANRLLEAIMALAPIRSLIVVCVAVASGAFAVNLIVPPGRVMPAGPTIEIVGQPGLVVSLFEDWHASHSEGGVAPGGTSQISIPLFSAAVST